LDRGLMWAARGYAAAADRQDALKSWQTAGNHF